MGRLSFDDSFLEPRLPSTGTRTLKALNQDPVA